MKNCNICRDYANNLYKLHDLHKSCLNTECILNNCTVMGGLFIYLQYIEASTFVLAINVCASLSNGGLLTKWLQSQICASDTHNQLLPCTV